MDTEGDAMKRDAIGTDDEGDLQIDITAHSGKVVLAFWVGLTPTIARGLADALNKYAGEA